MEHVNKHGLNMSLLIILALRPSLLCAYGDGGSQRRSAVDCTSTKAMHVSADSGCLLSADLSGALQHSSGRL